MRSRSIFAFDVYILCATLALLTVGILFVYSSGLGSGGEPLSREYVRQIIWAVSGLIILVCLSFVQYKSLRPWVPYVYVAGLVLILFTLLFGRVVNGTRAWLGVGILGIQPSEFMKIAAIMVFAVYLERAGANIQRIPYLAAGSVLFLIPMAMILMQPDFGTASVFFPIYLGMCYMAGARVRHLVFVGASALLILVFTMLPAWEIYIHGSRIPAFAVFSNPRIKLLVLAGLGAVALVAMVGLLMLKRGYFYWIAYAMSILALSLGASLGARAAIRDYQLMRLVVFMNPYVDPRGAGWNVIQSVTAVGSGGIAGKGFLQGTQSHYQYLPEQSTDFIFSILAEEWGFAGTLLIFGLFLVILLRGLYIAGNARDSFAGFMASGIVAMIFTHFAVNVGMAIGVMPVAGVPLFLVSYGGSSMWTALAGIGILMSIYQHRYRY
ncbi:MAG: rod shape-determining protein RodA [Spirochaetaceae bacterium]|nr:MAG: rod shape-determining protein RodA [Spirochaetaceae bacterium]